MGTLWIAQCHGGEGMGLAIESGRAAGAATAGGQSSASVVPFAPCDAPFAHGLRAPAATVDVDGPHPFEELVSYDGLTASAGIQPPISRCAPSHACTQRPNHCARCRWTQPVHRVRIDHSHAARRSTLMYTGYQIMEPKALRSRRGKSPRHNEATPSVDTIWRNP